MIKLVYWVGINELQEKFPYEFPVVRNGGLTVARAASDPEILLADEPTGALDSKSSAAFFWMFDVLMTEESDHFWWWPAATSAANEEAKQYSLSRMASYNQIFRGGKTEHQVFQEISDTYLSWQVRWVLMIGINR